MLGIIAGEIIGSPYKKKNLEGLQDSFVLFEANRDMEIKQHRGSASVTEVVYEAEAGKITDAVLNSYRVETLGNINKKHRGSALACAIVLGTTDADMNLSKEDHDASVRNYLSSFPADYHEQMTRLADASYLLRSGTERDICRVTGFKPELDSEVSLMGCLRGQFVETENHELLVGDGKPSDDRVIDAATWAIRTSYSYREAVEKAVKLGGNSDTVAAITGGLAELVFDTDNESYKRDILLPLEGKLEDEQKAAIKEYDHYISSFNKATKDESRPIKDTNIEEVEILSFPYEKNGKAGYDTVYCVSEDRDDIRYAVLQLKDNPAIMTPTQFNQLKKTLEERQQENRLDIQNQIDEALKQARVADKQQASLNESTSSRSRQDDYILSEKDTKKIQSAFDASDTHIGAAYITSQRPEERILYYSKKDGKIYTPITLSHSAAFGLHMAADIDRMKNRTVFERFRSQCMAIRDEQERMVEHNPANGHLAFDNAWWLRIERDRVCLMKGSVERGEFGINKYGNLRVNSNIIGGTMTSGERLENAMDNMKVFSAFDNEYDILAKLREKCLDESKMADEAIFSEEKSVYEKPEGEEHIRTNRELMMLDLAGVRGNLPKERPLMSFAELQPYIVEGHKPIAVTSTYAASSEVTTFDERLSASANKGAVFTIGHSNLTFDEFVKNLRLHGIDTVRDIRSYPCSKNYPHFDKEALKEALKKVGIDYIYNGSEMGNKTPFWKTLVSKENIVFTRSEGGYKERTTENAQNSDLTIAFAADFNTAGEKCTAIAAKGKYLSYPIDKAFSPEEAAKDLVSLFSEEELSKELKLNIAGNGMYTLAKYGFTQSEINQYITQTIKCMQDEGVKIGSIISGGQTGVDEAGIIAARDLGIPAEVHTTKYWTMRGEDNVDVFNEQAFKTRFISEIPEGKDLTCATPYHEVMKTKDFQNSFVNIIQDARKGKRQVLLTAEPSPTDSHRYACLGYALSHPEIAGRRFDALPVQHIKRDGTLIPQIALEKSLCKKAGVEYSVLNLIPLMEKESVRLNAPRDLNNRKIFSQKPQDKQQPSTTKGRRR